jgi:hypothetical protein
MHGKSKNIWVLKALKDKCAEMKTFVQTKSVIFREPATLIKKKTQFSSYIKKFRWDQLQSHI